MKVVDKKLITNSNDLTPSLEQLNLPLDRAFRRPPCVAVYGNVCLNFFLHAQPTSFSFDLLNVSQLQIHVAYEDDRTLL